MSDPFAYLRGLTAARIGLRRTGVFSLTRFLLLINALCRYWPIFLGALKQHLSILSSIDVQSKSII